ncbi:MAG: hypothetical protein NZM27_04600, partial [Acetobacteraceae bacterium]|nr:hypothetical protein [Acetobacteraceae bacterium]
MLGDRLTRWLVVSAALHLVLLAALLLDWRGRRFQEPVETALAVELVAPAAVAEAPVPRIVAAPPAPDAPEVPRPPVPE